LIVLLFVFFCTDDCTQPQATKQSAPQATESPEQPQTDESLDKDTAPITDAVDQAQEDAVSPVEDEEIKSVILVNSGSKVDYASCAILSAVKNAEIVMINKNLSAASVEKIQSMAADEAFDVYVIGGEYVVAQRSLKPLYETTNVTVTRLSGIDMAHTALAVIGHISEDLDFTNAYVANFGNPASLNLATKMAQKDSIAVFPADYYGISDDVLFAISQYGVKNITILGNDVGSNTQNKLARIVGEENITR
jgi:hypothetical protein